jgi:hypothetical protein
LAAALAGVVFGASGHPFALPDAPLTVPVASGPASPAATAAPAPIVAAPTGGPQDALVSIDDLLPLANDLQPKPSAVYGAADNAQAAAAWPDPEGARRRFEGWGRTGGYQATFVRARPVAIDRPVFQVWHDVSSYKEPNGGRDALKDTVDRLKKTGAAALTPLDSGETGAVYTVPEGPFTSVHVLSRRGNVLSWLAVTTLGERLAAEPLDQLRRALDDRLP